MSIPEEHKSAIIHDGLAFMRSITDCYGTDTGLNLWDQICSVLDPNVRGEIFLAMLTGQYSPGRLCISGISSNRVSVIKTIREVTGLGLKEAKDLNDDMQVGLAVSISISNGLTREYAAQKLRAVGVIVN